MMADADAAMEGTAPDGRGDISRRAIRLESLAILLLLIGLHAQRDASWLLFGALFLAPDVSALGYLVNPRLGALGYTLGHTVLGPIALGGLGLLTASALPVTLALIWAAHIAFDRAIDYGLRAIDVPTRRDALAFTPSVRPRGDIP